MTVRLLTFATEPIGYYNILLQSAKRHGYQIETLGMGEEWGGLMTKYKYTSDYIQAIPESQDDDIIVFLDGYDTFILGDVDILMERYKKFNKPLVFGSQWNRENGDTFTKFIISLFSSGYADIYNSGSYMGPVWALKLKFKMICNTFDCNLLSMNDQKQLNKARNIHPEFFNEYTALDIKGSIFFNASYYSCISYGPPFKNISWFTDIEIDKTDNKLISRDSGIEPIFISGPGNVNLEQYIVYKGYDIKDVVPRDDTTFLLEFIREYMLEFIIYYGTLGLVNGAIIFLIIKLIIYFVKKSKYTATTIDI
jgi:hypothetical protein